MKEKSKYVGLKWFSNLIIPLFLVACIQVMAFYPACVEQYYSTTIYPKIGNALRVITRFFSFSVGDIFYLLVAISLLVSIVVGIMKLIRHFSFQLVLKFLLKGIQQLLWWYIIFNFLWGFNYNRSGIAHQLKLSIDEYSTDELCALTDSLIAKTNYYRMAVSTDSVLLQKEIDSIFTVAADNYTSIQNNFPFLKYQYASVKGSLYNKLSPYVGFTGYYNPFSGEAQLRSDVPSILVPFTTSHEIAHQLGYASETEANFVGYLAVANGTDNYSKYSTYLDLYKYARGQLYERNTFPSGDVPLNKLVKNDLRAIRQFFLKEQNSVSPVSANLYDAYLKANHQGKGINSYNDVIAYVMAYYKKTGKL